MPAWALSEARRRSRVGGAFGARTTEKKGKETRFGEQIGETSDILGLRRRWTPWHQQWASPGSGPEPASGAPAGAGTEAGIEVEAGAEAGTETEAETETRSAVTAPRLEGILAQGASP